MSEVPGAGHIDTIYTNLTGLAPALGGAAVCESVRRDGRWTVELNITTPSLSRLEYADIPTGLAPFSEQTLDQKRYTVAADLARELQISEPDVLALLGGYVGSDQSEEQKRAIGRIRRSLGLEFDSGGIAGVRDGIIPIIREFFGDDGDRAITLLAQFLGIKHLGDSEHYAEFTDPARIADVSDKEHPDDDRDLLYRVLRFIALCDVKASRRRG